MELARCFAGATRVELVLSPVALVATLAAYEEPLVLVAVIAPLVWLLDNFSKDRAAAMPRPSSSTAPTAAR